MSILRENQIKQILDDENILKRQVIDRERGQIKDYQESIKPPEILDVELVNSNKNAVKNFISKINELYLRLRVLRESNQFIDTLTNSKGNDYRKFISLLNIEPYFIEWENLMSEYTNIKLNQVTKENMKSNLQKIEPFIDEIIRILEKNINSITGIWRFQNNQITDKQLFREYVKSDKFINLTEQKETEIIQEMLNIDTILLLMEHIESLAFFKEIQRQYKANNYNYMNKADIAYSIIEIINEIQRETRSVKLTNKLKEKYSNLLPELSPYFKRGINEFHDAFEELDAMDGHIDAEIAEEKEDAGSDVEDLAIPEGYAGLFPEIGRQRRNQLLDPEEEREQVVRRQMIERRRRADEERRRAPTPEQDEDVRDALEYAGEGKPKNKKKGRRTQIKKVLTNGEKQKPSINFDDENNDEYYINN